MPVFQKTLTFIIVFCIIYIGVVNTDSSSTSYTHSSNPTTTPPVEIFSTEPFTESTLTASTTDSSTTLADVITSTVPVEESKTTSVHEFNDLLETSSSTIPTTIKIAATSSGSSRISSSSHHSSVSSDSTSPYASTAKRSKQTLIPEQTTQSPLLSKSGFPFRPSLIRCPKDYIDEYATSGSYIENGTQKENCRNAEDCQRAGWATNKSMKVNVMCAFSEDFLDSGCCYQETKGLCAQGNAVIPLEQCATLDDCNLHEEKSTKRWCDPVSKTCCRYEVEQELFCPDYTIPLMNEPECKNYKEDDIYSGKCPIPNGICRHGHCCPDNRNGTMLPGAPYKTQMDCSDSTVIPKNLTFGYCDPSTRKVFIMSEKNSDGKNNKMLESFCMSGSDCGRSYTIENVCVRISEKTPRCFINPTSKYHIPKKRSLFWVSTLAYVSLGTSVLALLFAILYKVYTIDDSVPGERSVSLSSEEQSLPLIVTG